MTGIPSKTTRYTLELAGSASPNLNAAFNEFIKPPESTAATPREIGSRALAAVTFRSDQSVEYHPPAQTDRGPYGEGEGIALGRYIRSLDRISHNKVKISSEPDKSGLEDDGTVWFTLEPSSTERDVILQPPLYPSKAERLDPNLKMYFVVPEQYRVGPAEAAVALNSLRVNLARDEARRLDEQRRIANNEKIKHFGRTFFAMNLRVHQTKRKVPAQTQGTESLPDVA